MFFGLSASTFFGLSASMLPRVMPKVLSMILDENWPDITTIELLIEEMTAGG